MFLKDIKPNHKLTPAMMQYVDFKKHYNNELLFFRMGDFYELFFDDAILTAKELNITLTRRGLINQKEIPMCGIPYHSINNYLPKLIQKGFSVAICEQTETPQENKIKGQKGPLKREVVRVITPGTLIEENLLNSNQNNFIGCLFVTKSNFSISWLDISTGVFLTDEYSNLTLEELNYKLTNLLSKIGLSELLVSEINFDLYPLSEYNNVKKLEHSEFSYDKNYNVLREYYSITNHKTFEKLTDLQIIGCGVLISYLKKTFLLNLPKITFPHTNKENLFMEVDKVTIQSLEIIHRMNGEKKGSLINVLDKTKTPSGSRLFKQRLLSPLYNKKKIEDRLNLAKIFCDHHNCSKAIKSFLTEFSDLERALSRLFFNSIQAKDFLIIANSIDLCDRIISEIKSNKINKNNILNSLLIKFSVNLKLSSQLKKSINQNLSLADKNSEIIMDGFDQKLDEIRFFKKNSSNILLKLQEKYIEITTINSTKIKFNKVLGYHIEFRAIHLEKIKKHSIFIHRQTTAQTIRFTTEELLKIEKDLIEAENLEKNRQKEILNNLKDEILCERNNLLHLSNFIARLDIAIMTSDQLLNDKYVIPEISNDNQLEIYDGRHPVIEDQTDFSLNDFTPNDCILKNNDVWLLTGPNMAGKSTFLRQNAILIIMAQSGLFVPAKKAKIGLVDKIFSRIGASDNLSKGQSTFMVEMKETSSIINRATKKSFIIFDEIGRGTSTFDGLAIAWAVLEYLVINIKPRILFATHYHEITEITNNFKNIKNYKMKIQEWENTINFIYRVERGKSNNSYGVHVAKLAGFPENLIRRAFEILYSFENNKSFNTRKVFDGHSKKSFFSKETEILNNLDLDNITPIRALEILYQIKNYNKND